MAIRSELIRYENHTVMYYIKITIIALLFDIVCKTVYRLYLSPNRHIPGPKLAASSLWYQIYWNIWRGGQLTFHIQDLHRIYGPIVRIGPNEVHINDPEFYDTIYSNAPFAKHYPHAGWLNAPLSGFATIGHAQHRLRRAALNQFFSRQAILALSHEIQDRASTVCTRLNREFKDVIIQYAFGHSYNFIECEDFNSNFVKAIKDLFAMLHVFVYFPWTVSLMNCFPDWLVGRVSPQLESVLEFRKDVLIQARAAVDTQDKELDPAAHNTIFRGLIESSLPAEEKTWQRLNDEAQVVVGAGLETVKTVLRVAICHILLPENAYMLGRLREELYQAWPDTSVKLTLPQLEKLPYLTAVLWEALRLSYGASMRLARVSQVPFKYGSFIIPPGTLFSMSSYALHHNENIFPDSHRFEPTRWLADPITGAFPTGPDGIKPLTKYVASFSRGARSCVGMNLAWAELYFFSAEIFRTVDMEIYQTTAADVKMAREQYIMQPYVESQGVQVLIK